MTNNSKDIERYINLLKELPQITQAKHLRSVTSSVTTNWIVTKILEILVFLQK